MASARLGLVHQFDFPSASTACMKASVTPIEILKLVRSPRSLAWMKLSISGWSQRSTPICAPRRAPADSTVAHDASNTFMNDTGPTPANAWRAPARHRADRREVVADAAAAAHGLGGLRHGGVDAGLAVLASDTESPTGCTKQLISVAWMPVPAAELMRPAGTKPFSSAQRKRAAQASR
jgi:hypothetical protein